MKKLAIICSHPIQYYAPVFKLLSHKVKLKVFYTDGAHEVSKFDEGFKKEIKWDLPLLDGYDYEFLSNISTQPGTHHFNGIINPNAIEKINEFDPDSILIYGWAYKSHLKIIRYFKGKRKIYFRGDSTLLDLNKSLKKILRTFWLKYIYKHVTAAFYVGTANKNYFKCYGLAENQLIFAPHAIDNDRFAIDRTLDTAILRTRLNVKKDEILILFAGKFEAKKNPLLLLQAFADLDLANVHLLFVGNGNLEENLKAKTNQLQSAMASRVHFIDFQNQTQMPAVYQACDLFCLPSQGPGETWGLAVNEAMASSKAILVSDRVGCALDLVNINNGRIFKSNDIGDLKQKLVALTESKTMLEQMGKFAAEDIKSWSFEVQTTIIADHVNR